MRTKLLALLGCVLALSVGARADEPQRLKPSPEMDKLHALIGDWDSVINVDNKEMKGTATYTLGYGGFWVTEQFKGGFKGEAGTPVEFEGRGTIGYDPVRKKYVSTWINSMSPIMLVMEGNFDKSGKTYTEIGSYVGKDGKPQEIKYVIEFKDKDEMLGTMYALKDGAEHPIMTTDYKRKK